MLANFLLVEKIGLTKYLQIIPDREMVFTSDGCLPHGHHINQSNMSDGKASPKPRLIASLFQCTSPTLLICLAFVDQVWQGASLTSGVRRLRRQRPSQHGSEEKHKTYSLQMPSTEWLFEKAKYKVWPVFIRSVVSLTSDCEIGGDFWYRIEWGVFSSRVFTAGGFDDGRSYDILPYNTTENITDREVKLHRKSRHRTPTESWKTRQSGFVELRGKHDLVFDYNVKEPREGKQDLFEIGGLHEFE